MHRHSIGEGSLERGTVPEGIAGPLALARVGPWISWLGPVSIAGPEPRMAVVGSRRASERSLLAISQLASRLAEAGAVIVSGAAPGTDRCAHDAALEGRAPTIACLPTGIEWSAQHDESHAVLHRAAEEGRALLLSLCAPMQPPTRQSPVIRNRLIAALAGAVIVGEAPIGSGTWYCVRAARELDLPVFLLEAAPDADVKLRALHRRLLHEGARQFDIPGAADPSLADEIIRAAAGACERRRRAEGAQQLLFGGGPDV